MIVVVKNNIERYNLIIGYYLNKLKLISITGAFYSETFNLKKYFILFFYYHFLYLLMKIKVLQMRKLRKRLLVNGICLRLVVKQISLHIMIMEQ